MINEVNFSLSGGGNRTKPPKSLKKRGIRSSIESNSKRVVKINNRDNENKGENRGENKEDDKGDNKGENKEVSKNDIGDWERVMGKSNFKNSDIIKLDTNTYCNTEYNIENVYKNNTENKYKIAKDHPIDAIQVNQVARFTQEQSYENKNKLYDDLIESMDERLMKIIEMSNSVEELNSIMKVLAETVNYSQSDLDTIEKNMIRLKENTEKGANDIEKAKEYLDGTRYYKGIALGVGGIILSVPLSLVSLKLGVIALTSSLIGAFVI